MKMLFIITSSFGNIYDNRAPSFTMLKNNSLKFANPDKRITFLYPITDFFINFFSKW